VEKVEVKLRLPLLLPLLLKKNERRESVVDGEQKSAVREEISEKSN